MTSLMELCGKIKNKMKLNKLKQSRDLEEKYNRIYIQFDNLLSELEKIELRDNIVTLINNSVEELNSFSGVGKKLIFELRRKQSKILQLVEKEHKIVPKGYYQATWLALGMAVFGVPMGVALGSAFGNMAFLGIGLPLGLSIGLAVGASMDKKAAKEGRQIDIEIK